MLLTKPTPASKHARVNNQTFSNHQMKKDIHPVLNPVVFVDVSTGKKFNTVSTASSKKSENIDGVDHHVLVRDITMDSHPAFTGEKRFVDTAGRVEKFQSKFSRKRS